MKTKRLTRPIPYRVFAMLFVLLMVFFQEGRAGFAAPPPGDSPEEQGYFVFKKRDDMNQGYQDATAMLSMTLMNAAGEESRRKMHYRLFEMSEDGDRVLITFKHPRDIKGTGLLTFEHINKDDDQWLYLPALKRVKRIASRNKSGSFVGSEFSYEDIASNDVEKYRYQYLREDIYKGVNVWVIERYPKNRNSGYTRITTWVDQSNYQTLQHHFYDRKNVLLKVEQDNDLRLYLKKFWRAKEIVMENKQSQKKTILKFEKWQFQQGLKKSAFTKRALERSR